MPKGTLALRGHGTAHIVYTAPARFPRVPRTPATVVYPTTMVPTGVLRRASHSRTIVGWVAWRRIGPLLDCQARWSPLVGLGMPRSIRRHLVELRSRVKKKKKSLPLTEHEHYSKGALTIPPASIRQRREVGDK